MYADDSALPDAWSCGFLSGQPVLILQGFRDTQLFFGVRFSQKKKKQSC